jgi:hypothetical protein
MSLAWIPKGTLDKMRKLCFTYLWQGNKDKKVLPWVRWERIATPKVLGGWGLKNIFYFSTALAEKCSWRLIKTSSLWTQVIHQKYISPLTILDWVHSSNKSTMAASIIWKALTKAFVLVGASLVWRVCNGRMVLLGLDPWVGSQLGHNLPEGVRQRLTMGGYFHLAIPSLQTCGIKDGWKDLDLDL